MPTDLDDKHAAQTVKLVGTDSLGMETEFASVEIQQDGKRRVLVGSLVDALFPAIQTTVNRDVKGRISSIVETDGSKTKTTTITRNPDGSIASIAEVIV